MFLLFTQTDSNKFFSLSRSSRPWFSRRLSCIFSRGLFLA